MGASHYFKITLTVLRAVVQGLRLYIEEDTALSSSEVDIEVGVGNNTASVRGICHTGPRETTVDFVELDWMSVDNVGPNRASNNK